MSWACSARSLASCLLAALRFFRGSTNNGGCLGCWEASIGWGELRGDWSGWILLFAAYFVGVITFAAWFILQARNRTSVYNVDAREFEQVLRRAIDESSVAWTLEGYRTLNLQLGSPQPATLRWQPFPSLQHVSLSWENVSAEKREEIENRMEEILHFISPPDNPAAGWFFTCASMLLLFSVLTLGALVALRLLRLGA